MADLRSRFIEDYAGGLLNVSRQELASNGEVLSQDGFLTDSTIYVEDGVGTKSGLRLGVGLAEVVDPTTQTGIVNVRYADRTYTKIRDTKIFTTAIASAQAALAESVTESLTNIESAIDYLEIFDSQSDTRISALEAGYTDLTTLITSNKDGLTTLKNDLEDKIKNSQLGIGENNNIRLGLFALSKLENGSSNVAVGFYSLAELYSGNNNIAVGHQSGLNLIEGNNNILIGADSKVSNPRASNQIVLGSPSHDYLWSKTDIYTPAVTLGANDSSSKSLTTTGFFKFIQSLEFKKISWEKGQSYVVIEPESLKRAEESLGYKGYSHPESNSVSNAKLVPLLMQTVSGLFDILGINFSPESLITTTNGSDSGDVAVFEGSGEPIGNQADDPFLGNALNTDFVPDDNQLLSVNSAQGKTIEELLKDEDPIENFRRNFSPIGGIIMWSNYGGKPVPDGWVLCDGTNGTPDLRDKFIIGAGSKDFPVGKSKDSPPEVPLHTHGASGEVEWVEKVVMIAGQVDSQTPMVPDPFEGAQIDVPALQGDAQPVTAPLLQINSILGGVPEELATGLIKCKVSTYQSECNSEENETIERNEPVKVTVEETGEEEPLTFPPFYALAFIMRIY